MRKTVLITGASGGLGLEFARIYAREGFDLVVVARSEGKLYKLESELETQYDCMGAGAGLVSARRRL